MAVPSATVIQYYTGVLRLQPTAQQVTLYSNAADAATLLNILETEALTQINPIIRLYQGAFNRVPDSGGLTFIAGQYVNGPVGTTGAWSLTQISQNFCSSPEFTATYGSSTPVATTTGATAYISALYNNILGRVPATSEVAYWQAWTSAQLAAGNSAAKVTAQLLTMFTESPEFIQSSAPYIQNFQAASAQGTETYTGTLWAQGIGETFTLTTGVDAPGFGAFAAGSPTGNSTTFAVLSGTSGVSTLNVYDQIQATGGNNNMTLVDITGSQTLPAAQVSGIQTLNARSAVALGDITDASKFNVSGWTGLTQVNVTQTQDVSLTAAATTAVNVNVTGDVRLVGGSTQTVTTTGANGGAVTLSGAAGAISVTDAAQGAGDIVINGGSTVTVTATATDVAAGSSATGDITIGGTVAPTGAVNVTQNLVVDASGTDDMLGGDITVTGGTVVNVNIASSSAITADDVTAGSVTVNGTAVTTAVNVTESQVAAVSAVSASASVAPVTFGTLQPGESVTIAGLTFTAKATGSALTAANVAAAFASLANGSTGNASITTGTYSGTLTGWSTGSRTSASIDFTAAATGANVLTYSATDASQLAAPAKVTVATSGGNFHAGTAAVVGNAALVAGAITVNDVNASSSTVAGTITSVTANGFVGLTINDDSLTTLNLAGTAGVSQGTVDINNSGLLNNTATTLGVSLSTNTLTRLTDDGIYKTLNVSLNGNSAIGDTSASGDTLTTVAATALNLSGTGVLTLGNTASNTATGLAALKTVTISGAAGLTALLSSITTLTDVNASATSGANTVAIDASAASYEGGSGADVVTTTSAGVNKTITLGAGNDKVVLGATSTLGAGGYLIGGLGVDTLDMTSAAAAAASANSAFVTHISGFEALALSALTSGTAVSTDVGMLGTANSVVIDADAGTGTAAKNTLANFASGGTLTVNSSDEGGVTLSNVNWTATGATTDTATIVMNAATTNSGTVGFTVASAGLDTVTVTSSGVTTAGAAVEQELTLADTSTTTITINGGSALTLHASGDTHLTTINAAAATGGLTVGSTDTGATVTTITGSATAANNIAAYVHLDSSSVPVGDDTAVTLNGGSGNDTLTANSGLDVINVGAGLDTVVVKIANLNSNNIYTTVNGMGAGDVLSLEASSSNTFNATKIVLSNTSTFQQYLDTATASSTAGTISWFQFGGNTYVVNDLSTGTSFDAGTDMVVALTGTIDLSNSHLATAANLLIQ